MNPKARHARTTQVGNRPLAVAMQEKRRSNASGTHSDRRTKRNRSRSARRANAIADFR